MRRPVYKVVNEVKVLLRDKPYKVSMFQHVNDYMLTYKEGMITKARSSSLGVFCFKTKQQAREFMGRKGWVPDRKIMCVLPIGRGKVPKLICAYGGLPAFYRGDVIEDDKMPPPYGTICYPAVKVLKEVK